MNEEKKITGLAAQARDKNRVNVFVEGRFEFSLTLAQVAAEGVRAGLVVDEARLMELRKLSDFGKYYGKALEYALARPRSEREMRDYLRRKTFGGVKRRRGADGEYETVRKEGMPAEMLEPIIEELKTKKYVDDRDFARFWVENRRLKKGISGRRLREELLTKGVACDIIDEVLALSERADADEIKKIVAKKRKRYDDKQLMAYLVRQGFDYAIVKEIVQTDFAVPDGLKSGMD